METKHTPEPWMVEGINVWQENGLDVDQSSIATTHGPNAEAIAQRIVSCVNACKGINPEAVPELLAFAQMIVNGGLNEAGEATIESEAYELIAKATK